MKNLENNLKEEESNPIDRKKIFTSGVVGGVLGIGVYLLASYISNRIVGSDFYISQVPYKDWITSIGIFGGLGIIYGFESK